MNARSPVTGPDGTAIDMVGADSPWLVVNSGASLCGTVSAGTTNTTPEPAADSSQTGGNAFTPTGVGHCTNIVNFDKTGDGERELAVFIVHGQQNQRHEFVASAGEASRCKFFS